MSNVIHVDFSPGFRDSIYRSIKYLGFNRTEESMIDLGYHPSFIKSIFKNIMKCKGW